MPKKFLKYSEGTDKKTKEKKLTGITQNLSSERKPAIMNSFCRHGNKNDHIT